MGLKIGHEKFVYDEVEDTIRARLARVSVSQGKKSDDSSVADAMIIGIDTSTVQTANFTADNATNIFTSAAHGLTNGDIVQVSNSGGALPTGLSASTDYFVVNAATDTFQLAAAPNGSAIEIDDDGTGTHTFTEFLKVILTSADVASNRQLIIKDESGDAGTNNITIETEASETIDGAADATIGTNYALSRLYSNGSNWFTW